MEILNVPEIFLFQKEEMPELFIYDYKMTGDVIKSKVNLNQNMFSFLQTGKKKIHFSDTAVEVNPHQSLLIKSGNCLWTELLDNTDIYFCKLFFFSQQNVVNFLNKNISNHHSLPKKNVLPYFIIENDEYINSFVNSLTIILKLKNNIKNNLLIVKFEEIMCYLLEKYGNNFVLFLHSIITTSSNNSFKNIIEANTYSNLNLEEIAFLCNMSLSTFKRYFKKEYNLNPGKWILQKRLEKARDLLKLKEHKPSDIFFDLGYNNLSNFSIAFKNKFGINPKDI